MKHGEGEAKCSHLSMSVGKGLLVAVDICINMYTMCISAVG